MTRILKEIGTLEEAERIEETIKTGYVDTIIENLVNWIGAEEDLSESYEKFSKFLASPEEREIVDSLHVLSASNIDVLNKMLEEFEGFDSEYRKRIRLVKKLRKNT